MHRKDRRRPAACTASYTLTLGTVHCISLSDCSTAFSRMRQPWVPDSVYATAGLACLTQHTQAQNPIVSRPSFMLAAASESKQQTIPLYSAKYFQACTIGGILACGNNCSQCCCHRIRCTINLQRKQYSGTQVQHTPALRRWMW